MIKRANCVVGLQAMIFGLAAAACSAQADPELAVGGDESVSEQDSELRPQLAFVNCGQSQQSTISSFTNFLSDRVYSSGGGDMRRCLQDSFLSYVNGAEWGGDLWREFNRNVVTTVTCTSNIDSTCAGSHNFAGCASIGISGEAVTLANQFINDPNVPQANKAGVLAHELAHNYGHSHPNFANGDSEYDFTAPQRARACVENSNFLPVGQSRTNGMPGEVELGYVGRFGGSPFEFAGTGDQFVSGIQSFANATINGLEIQFSNGADSRFFKPLVGTQNGVHNTDRRTCPAGRVVIGVRGNAGAIVNSLQVLCASRSNTADAAWLPFTDGNNNETPYESVCPAGKAVRQIRGRAGSSIDQLTLVCDDIWKSFSSAHAPHTSGPMFGSASGKLFQLRCSGNGALSSLEGRTDNSNINRLGAFCQATGGTLPVTPTVTHPAAPWLGGTGGNAFHNPCPPGELMVGVNVRSGGSINGVGAVCAPASQWDESSGGAHAMGSVGGAGGTLTQQMCPSFQFVTGLNLWGGASVVNGLQVVCSDMR